MKYTIQEELVTPTRSTSSLTKTIMIMGEVKVLSIMQDLLTNTMTTITRILLSNIKDLQEEITNMYKTSSMYMKMKKMMTAMTSRIKMTMRIKTRVIMTNIPANKVHRFSRHKEETIGIACDLG